MWRAPEAITAIARHAVSSILEAMIFGIKKHKFRWSRNLDAGADDKQLIFYGGYVASDFLTQPGFNKIKPNGT
jgi:hypothetical protein